MYPIADSNLAPFLFAGAVAVMIMTLLRMGRRRMAKQPKQTGAIVHAERPTEDAKTSRVASPTEIAQWEVQMHDLARDLSAQLDSKMIALQHLIQEADRAAERIERAMEGETDEAQEPEPSTPSQPHVSDSDGGDAPTPEPEADEPTNQADRLRDAIPPQETAEPDSEEPSDDANEEETDLVDRYQEIYTLSDYGFSAAEIADRVGSPVGEVELILGLRTNR